MMTWILLSHNYEPSGEKTGPVFPTRFGTNRLVQSQEKTRSLKFRL